jgi:hypothetical protein
MAVVVALLVPMGSVAAQEPVENGAPASADSPQSVPGPDAPLPTEAVSDHPTSSLEQPTRPLATTITVLSHTLFAIVTDANGVMTVTPSTAIPYVVGRSCYSWSLRYRPLDGDLILSEELVLPGPARNWGTGDMATQVNPQRSAAMTERRFDAATGMAEAGWCVAKDDPVGPYRYIVRQGGHEMARFDFTVGDLL